MGERRKPKIVEWDADDEDRSDRPYPKSPTGGSKQNLRLIGCPGCWCGKPYGHDWPGRDNGTPHPREN